MHLGSAVFVVLFCFLFFNPLDFNFTFMIWKGRKGGTGYYFFPESDACDYYLAAVLGSRVFQASVLILPQIPALPREASAFQKSSMPNFCQELL